MQLARSNLNSSTDRWKLSPEPMGREFMADVFPDRHQRGGQAAETLAFGELDARGIDGGGGDGAGAGLAVHLLGRQFLRAVAAGGHSRRGLAALAVAGRQQTGPQVAEFGSFRKKARRWASKVGNSVGLGRESASRMQVGNPCTLKRHHALLFQRVCPSTSNASI